MNTSSSSSSLQQLKLKLQLRLSVALSALLLLLRAGSVPLVFAMPKVSMITGGKRSKPGWFPYFVHMDFIYCSCGGALIAPDIVLTAAHCKVCEFSNSPVYIGAWKRGSLKGGAQIGYIKKWINHPTYVGNLLGFDYALAKLEEPVEIDQSLVRLELNDNSAFPKAGTALITMGLGKTKKKWIPNYLKNVTIPYVSNERCSVLYSGNLWDDIYWDDDITQEIDDDCFEDHGFDCWFDDNHDDDGWWDDAVDITPDMLCALDEEGVKDACFGDSGGPIVERSYRGDGTFVDIHVGIVSWGDGCADPNKPGVYARTSAEIDWIKTTACEELKSVATFCQTPSALPSHAPSRSKAPTMVPTMAPAKAPTKVPTKAPAKMTKTSKKKKSKKFFPAVTPTPALPPASLPPAKAPTKFPAKATSKKTTKKTFKKSKFPSWYY